jgi:hypothetical protein
VKHPEISRTNDGGEENGRQGSVHDAFSQQLSTRPETLSKVPETIEQESRKRKHLVGARRGDRNVTLRPSVNLNKIIGMRLASFPLSNYLYPPRPRGPRPAAAPAGPGAPAAAHRGLLYHSPSDVYHKNRSPDRTRAPRARSRGANRRRRSRARPARGGRTRTGVVRRAPVDRSRSGTVVSYSCEDRDL